jgi:hypothetical protein
MAKGMKIAKGNSIQIDSQIGPQLVTWANSTNTNTFTALGGVGGDPSVCNPRTIQVHYKTAAGVQKDDGFIVHQRGRKQFDVQSVSGGASTKTRCTLVESGTLSASQMYITFGYDGGGVQYASRISNRFVWTASNTVRLQYTLGFSAEVAYIQATADVVFYDYETPTSAYPFTLAVVEAV